MQLYLLRHGIAEDRQPGQADSDRRLTGEGIAQMEEVAKALKPALSRLDVILSSPYARAWKTAEIIADALGLRDQLREEKRLASGFRLGDLQQILAERPGGERVLLVGHNPDLPFIAEQLTGGGNIEMKKGGLIRVDFERAEPGSGTLQWLAPPALLLGARR